LRASFPFPLPPFLTVKRFCEDVLATNVNIDPSSAVVGERLHPNDAVASMVAQTKAIKRRRRFTITRNTPLKPKIV
jgi:hypothetical protein